MSPVMKRLILETSVFVSTTFVRVYHSPMSIITGKLITLEAHICWFFTCTYIIRKFLPKEMAREDRLRT